MTDTRAPPPAGPRQRIVVSALMVMFIGPLAASAWLYFRGADLQPLGRVNYGTLVEPPRPLPELTLASSAGAATASGRLRGRWSLLYVGRGGCAARCRQALSDMRAVRLTLGRDRERVQRVLLIDSSCGDCASLAAEHPDLRTARIDTDDGGRLLETFAGEAPPAPAGRIYLVDPLGNLMMSYPPDAAWPGVLRDLEKLLRLSQIG